MIVFGQNEYKGYQKASGKRNNSGPSGYKLRPAAVTGKAKGRQHKEARKRPIWVLLAHAGNFIGYQNIKRT